MSFAYITEKGVTISKQQGRFVVGRNRETILEIPEETLEGLLVADTVQLTSQAMVSLLNQGVPVTWLSSKGKYFGRLESTRHVNVSKQKQQFLLQDRPFSLELSRRVLMAKVRNQLTLLRRYNRERQIPSVMIDIHNMMTMADHMKTADERDMLMGYEGMAAKIYFSALGKMVDPSFSFEKRSKRPPLDPFNSLISFAYTLIMYELFTAITNEGLHPYVGFLHALKAGHPALASDLMEEWRPILADSFVLSLIQHHEIKADHFYKDEESQGVYLTTEGRKIFFQAYEKKMRSTNQYIEGKHSYRRSLNYQVSQYSQALMAESVITYEPILIR